MAIPETRCSQCGHRFSLADFDVCPNCNDGLQDRIAELEAENAELQKVAESLLIKRNKIGRELVELRKATQNLITDLKSWIIKPPNVISNHIDLLRDILNKSNKGESE